MRGPISSSEEQETAIFLPDLILARRDIERIVGGGFGPDAGWIHRVRSARDDVFVNNRAGPPSQYR